jgi:transposase InsO family protein
MAPLPQWPIQDRGIGSGTSTDRALWHSWASPDALLASFGQRPGVHLKELYGPGTQLRTTTGVHHATQSGADGMVERLTRTLKEQCAHRHRFETLQHASRVIGDWIGFYNTRRPHQALGMKTPAEAYALAT